MKKLIALVITLQVGLIVTHNLPEKDIPKKVSQHILKLESLTGSGTGFYVEHLGNTYLVSNKHVCATARVLKSTEGFHKVISLSEDHDLCLLETKRTGGLAISNRELKSLDVVHIVGHPMGNPITARKGRFVETKLLTLEYLCSYPIKTLMVSVAIFGGNSGSPLLDEDGDVLGVVFASDERTRQDGLAVPREVLIRFIEINME